MLELIIFILIGAYLVNYVHQKELKNKQEKYYVYDGLCDGRPTKWMTTTQWDGMMKLKFENGEIVYEDSKGKVMLVFEKGEMEFEKIVPN